MEELTDIDGHGLIYRSPQENISLSDVGMHDAPRCSTVFESPVKRGMKHLQRGD